MADFYTELIAQGLITPAMSASDILAVVESDLKAVFGADMDLTPETPQGRFAELLTLERFGVLGICAANANQMNPAYSTGLFLDAMAAIFGVTRIGVTSTRVLAALTGTAGTVIPAGSRAKTAAGDIFYAENDITIAVDGAGSGYFLSVEKGAIPCDSGTLTSIVSAVFGWDTIVGSGSLTIGLIQESDGSLWTRIQASRYTGRGLLEDIKSNLQSVTNIVSSFAFDNGTSTPDTTTISGVTIDPHSIIVVVDGGTDADVAQSIYEKKSGGCAYTAIKGAGTVTISTGNPASGGTVTIGGQVYTFRSTLSTGPTIPNEVKIAATLTDTAKNLTLSVNGGAGAGTKYSTGTTQNLTVTATDGAAGVVNLTGGAYGTVLCSNTATNTVSVVSTVPQNVTVLITDGAYGSSYPATFNRPKEIQIDVAISVKAENYSGSDLSGDIKAAIVSWSEGNVSQVDGLTIGRSVSPFEIASAVSILVPAPYVKACTICVHGGSPGTSEITITQAEVARITEANITVTII